MMPQDLSTIKELSHLCRIYVTEEEAACLLADLKNFMAYITQALPVKEIKAESLRQEQSKDCGLRPDVITADFSRDLFLADMPFLRDDMLFLPFIDDPSGNG